jgi:hypothetical protein
MKISQKVREVSITKPILHFLTVISMMKTIKDRNSMTMRRPLGN